MSSIVKVDTIQENTSANGITVDGLNIKDSKLVTANSVVAANITADAIDATKIADNAISEEHLDVTSITGHTAETLAGVLSKRASEYPTWQDQMDMQYKDLLNGTTTWKDAVAKVK